MQKLCLIRINLSISNVAMIIGIKISKIIRMIELVVLLNMKGKKVVFYNTMQ